MLELFSDVYERHVSSIRSVFLSRILESLRYLLVSRVSSGRSVSDQNSRKSMVQCDMHDDRVLNVYSGSKNKKEIGELVQGID
ncbi:unnamed protein product, partial [Iphiclides podalirius]